MSRIETRITSVQIVPGFPARFTILDPPGWDTPFQPSPSTRKYPEAGGERTCYGFSCLAPISPPPSSRQTEDSGGDICSSPDTRLPPMIGRSHALDTPLQPMRGMGVELSPTSKTEETRMLDLDDVSSERSLPPNSSSCVSGMRTVIYYSE